MWYIFFALACASLLGFAAISIWGNRFFKVKADGTRTMFFGVALSAFFLFIPIYMEVFRSTDAGYVEAVLISIHNMIRLFVVDGEFSFVTDNIEGASGWLKNGYSVFFAILFVVAPVLTFGFVLSFFKNVNAYKEYILSYNKDVFVFYGLNERSLSVAESLLEQKGRCIVFADPDVSDEDKQDFLEKAQGLAICFTNTPSNINFGVHSKKRRLAFFMMNDNESENTSEALRLISKYDNRKNTDMYYFYSFQESEMMFSASSQNIKIRRINEAQRVINTLLYDNGYDLLYATAEERDGIKHIRPLIVGMDEMGVEAVKALSWFCQMPGYRLDLNVCDSDGKSESRFEALCPELMDKKHNGVFDVAGEAEYKITFHRADYDLSEFEQVIKQLEDTTFVLVSAGTDEENLAIAVRLRRIFLRLNKKPVIIARMRDSAKKQVLENAVNFKGQAYDIDFIGDVNSVYSEKSVLDSDLEAEALKRHLCWGEEKDFWAFGYNYRSSVASVIHKKIKKLCGLSGADKDASLRTEEELEKMRIAEHQRWNAYMRSEGYVFRLERNDLMKAHNCLVPYDELPVREKCKDDF